MSKQLKFSRWRRLTGAHRITDKRIPTHRNESQRLTLFVPGSVLDSVERLAARAGLGNVQVYCEALFTRAVAEELEREHMHPGALAIEARGFVEQIAQDPRILEEWSELSTIDVTVQDDVPDAPQDPSGEHP